MRRLWRFLPLLLLGGLSMALPVRLYVDGVERTGNLDPASVEITRQLNQRQSEASLAVYRQPLGGYYHNPSTLPGVVAWWHMDETSGDLADASGNGHTLADAGSPTYRKPSLAPGYGGKSILFSKDPDDYFSEAGTADFDLTGAFSAGVWYRSEIGFATLMSFGVATVDVSPANHWHFEVGNGNTIQLRTKNAGVGGNDFYNHSSLIDGRAHFLVVTRTAGGVITFYVDGVGHAATHGGGPAANGSAGSSTFRIGIGDNSNIAMAGRLDEAFVSDEALSASVIAELYAQGRAGIEQLQLTERSQIVLKNADASRNRFGGYAVEVYPVREGAFDLGWSVRAVGWENDFETILIESYSGANKRTDQIISEIFAADPRLSGYDLTHVARGKVVDGLYRVRDRYLRDVMDELADIDEDAWWIDANGTDVYKRRQNASTTAAVRFSDEPSEIDSATIYSYRDLSYTRNFRNPANRAIVRGGSRYEDWNPFAFGAFATQMGTSNVFLIPGKGLVPRESETDVLVQINEGSSVSPSWSANLVVGFFGKDTLIDDGGDKEVLLQYGRQGGNVALHFDSSKAPPLHSLNSFRVYGRLAIKTRVEVVSQEAYQRLGERFYDLILVEDKITSVAQARAIARKLLGEQSRPLESVSFTTDADPDDSVSIIEVGHLVHLKSQRYGIDTYGDGLRGYRVQKIVTKLHKAGTFQFTELHLGTYQMGVNDLLKRLEKESIRYGDDEDEEDYLELVSGWEGSEQDINSSVGVASSVSVAP